MLGITEYLWRLLLANPILLRVVEAGGKRRRDWFTRMAYLGLLVGMVILFLANGDSTVTGSGLDAMAKGSAQLFKNMSYLQLIAVALLAPIFTAGAITQEKDSQTYDILLSTPLTNAQIVLGSLGSRLFFVLALLISGIPIFSITRIFGGVAIKDIVMSFLIAAATACVTGALAMAIATFKVGTRRTIFSFYLFIVIFMAGGILLDRLEYFQIPGNVINPTQPAHISWFTGINPFLALQSIFHHQMGVADGVFNEYSPPLLLDLEPGLQTWPIGWYLSNPAGFYVTFMFFLTFVLVMPSVIMLRRMAQSTSSIKGWLLVKLHLARPDRTKKPRYVWSNPIAWREARTKASAARASLVRYGFIGLGVIGAIVILVMYGTKMGNGHYVDASSYDASNRQLTVSIDGESRVFLVGPTTRVERIDAANNTAPFSLDQIDGQLQVETIDPLNGPVNKPLALVRLMDVPRRLSATQARDFLLGAVMVEFSVILLIVTNAAASTVTREKEDGSLDLLLTSPITSRYYIWGKLRGLVSFVLPLVAVPVISAGLFVLYDLIRFLTGNGQDINWIVYPEAVLVMPGTLIIVAAFSAILGMNLSLRCRTTVRAVMSSVGIVVGVCAALGFCGNALLATRGASAVNLAFSSFSPFTIMTVLIAPQRFAADVYSGSSDDLFIARAVAFLFGWIATGAYGLIVWSMYRTMVKNFDMTIRRQSR